MGNVFSEIKGKLGFGFMRLPMKGEEVDFDQVSEMVDLFLDSGFNYFDTAHVYIDGQSEKAMQKCLTSRYPRDRYLFANKLSNSCFEKEEDIRPFFEEQMKICGVTYFDFYLMHAQDAARFARYCDCRAYETAFALKKESKIRHVGLSFHDSADVLDRILSKYPELDFVQIQFNYMDYDDGAIQSRQCYEVCRKHGKPVMVMEPVKGGTLVNLPEDEQAILAGLGGGSNASYAIRFAAGFDGIEVVLSGMSNMDQMKDNVSYMKDFAPLSEKEKDALQEICRMEKKKQKIACTACRYCVEGCPMQIAIPDLFACMNSFYRGNRWASKRFHGKLTAEGGKASSCIACGQCEAACPQHLPIRDYLKEIAETFETEQ